MLGGASLFFYAYEYIFFLICISFVTNYGMFIDIFDLPNCFYMTVVYRVTLSV
jgi:hypothetical protein